MGEVKRLGYFVNGEFKESKTEKYSNAYDPSTGEVIAQVPCCTPDEVEEAVQAGKGGISGLVIHACHKAGSGFVSVKGTFDRTHGRTDYAGGKGER